MALHEISMSRDNAQAVWHSLEHYKDDDIITQIDLYSGSCSVNQ